MTSPTSGSDSFESEHKVLLAFFSRAGENYYYGNRRNLKVGNTAVLAGIIADRVNCDVFGIEAADPYPDDYEETVARNVREEQQNARPSIAGQLPSLDQYDTILLGSPVWNVQTPMIMRTFAEAFDWEGKTLHPFVTFAVSGLGTAVSDYRNSASGAHITEGLAVQGEKVADAGPAVDVWIDQLGIPPKP